MPLAGGGGDFEFTPGDRHDEIGQFLVVDHREFIRVAEHVAVALGAPGTLVSSHGPVLPLAPAS